MKRAITIPIKKLPTALVERLDASKSFFLFFLKYIIVFFFQTCSLQAYGRVVLCNWLFWFDNSYFCLSILNENLKLNTTLVGVLIFDINIAKTSTQQCVHTNTYTYTATVLLWGREIWKNLAFLLHQNMYMMRGYLENTIFV